MATLKCLLLLLALLQLALLVFLVVQIEHFTKNESRSEDKIEKEVDKLIDKKLDDYNVLRSPKPLITFEMDGRFGNWMLEYASLFLIAKQFNLSVHVLEEMHNELSVHFASLPLPKVGRGIPNCLCPAEYEYFSKIGQNSCPNSSCPCSKCAKWEVRLLSWVFMKRMSSIEGNKEIMGLNRILLWAFHSDLVVENLREMREIFVFREEIRERAQKFIRERVCARFQKKFGSKSKNDNNERNENNNDNHNNDVCWGLTLVSVHVRRGDYDQYLASVFDGHVPNISFHEMAMDRFRNNFDKVVFVVASDDIHFCRQHFGQKQDVVLVESQEFQLTVMDELAILVECNHSIYDVGSFGFWSAALKKNNENQVILADNYSRIPHPLLSAIKKKGMWTLLDVHNIALKMH